MGNVKFMPQPHDTPMTLAEFLLFEETSPVKHEFVGGHLVERSGERQIHEDLAGNLLVLLYGHLLDHPCKVHKGDTLVVVQERDAFYPDLVVFCDPRDFGNDKRTVRHPTLLIEILSPSTADWDRSGKFDHYRQLDSLQQYVIVHTDRVAIDLFQRLDEESWRLTCHTPGGTVPLESIDLSVAVDEVYAGVEPTGPAPRPPTGGRLTSVSTA